MEENENVNPESLQEQEVEEVESSTTEETEEQLSEPTEEEQGVVENQVPYDRFKEVNDEKNYWALLLFPYYLQNYPEYLNNIS